MTDITDRFAAAMRAPHPDDEAVDRFAAAMKVKLAEKRAEGRGGWDDPEQCSTAWLAELLRRHVEKGDPVDVGNFAMMLWNRGGSTTTGRRDALIAAVEALAAIVQADRVVHYQSVRNASTGMVDDDADRAHLARYDAALRLADAALGVDVER